MTTPAQLKHTPIILPEQDVEEVIAHYKTNDPKETVRLFQQRMPTKVTDLTFRASVHRGLPVEFGPITLNDAGLDDVVRDVLNPVLMLYGRSQVYDIVIIDTATPLIMLDSGVVLVISTGMIDRARSDDELLGYVAHEVAHEFFIRYSVYSKYLLQLVQQGGNEPALVRHITQMLAVIELQCDAFASLTLASLGRNPLELIRSIEQSSQDFPDHRDRNHPAESQRRKVVAGILPGHALEVPIHQSKAFHKLEYLLMQRQVEKKMAH